MCILLCRNISDDKITIPSAVEFPAFGFDINGDGMRYDLSATVYYKEKKMVMAITRLFLEVKTCNHDGGSCMMMIEFLYLISPTRTPW